MKNQLLTASIILSLASFFICWLLFDQCYMKISELTQSICIIGFQINKSVFCISLSSIFIWSYIIYVKTKRFKWYELVSINGLNFISFSIVFFLGFSFVRYFCRLDRELMPSYISITPFYGYWGFLLLFGSSAMGLIVLILKSRKPELRATELDEQM